MNTPYNLTQIVNQTNFADQAVLFNQALNGWFSNFILISFFVIIFGSLKVRGWSDRSCLATASYANLLVALLFWITGFIGGYALVISAVVAVVGMSAMILPFGQALDE